ncbi:MAG TPA: hypothetical protein VEK57_16795 [Thermoanaerobaculia bacterium]|nr:hypothetical protein [Thermoanaerobaculia bacterium]
MERHENRTAARAVHENLIQYLRRRPDAFPFRRDIDLRHFLTDSVGSAAEVLPVPAKIFLVDELEPKGYGFPVTKSPAVDELESRLQRWLDEELVVRGRETARTRDLLTGYRDHVLKLARNAEESSVLADYASVFWLLHSQQVSRLFTAFSRTAMGTGVSRDETERLKYALAGKWAASLRESVKSRGFLQLMLDNPLIAAEEYVSPDLRELRAYFHGYLRRDFNEFRKAFDTLRTSAADLLARDRIVRRAISLLGYPEASIPHVISLLDQRVWQLLSEHPSFTAPSELSIIDTTSRKLLELFVVQAMRRGILWMKTTAEGENIADDGTDAIYSRAIRPMNFGRRGVVEPIVYRYGLVYDITSFTETLGEIARGGKGEEQSSYRQMLEFQRELAEITRRYALTFEKFLGDGAFYTSRRATRTVQAAIAIQKFYANARANGFAFNKGMRIALNYGYYRLLPMQVSADGTQIMEFYGPGIVELSRLTTGKATKEIEDIQHLLLAHGYDQADVYRFFSPLSRSVDTADVTQQQREFYAYVNENGHLINEGIVVSIPFLRQLSTELLEDNQKMYRLRAPWNVYLGFPALNDQAAYIGIRLLGSVSLKGIGSQDIAEVVALSSHEAEISLLDEPKALLSLLQQERNRNAARNVGAEASEFEGGLADLVVCAAHAQSGSAPVILVGEWDPVSEEVRRPIQLDQIDAERYGLAVPLTAQAVESQSVAYQKLYRTLSRIETLPSFSVGAIRDNTNFSGFIIGATVEPL